MGELEVGLQVNLLKSQRLNRANVPQCCVEGLCGAEKRDGCL